MRKGHGWTCGAWVATVTALAALAAWCSPSPAQELQGPSLELAHLTYIGTAAHESVDGLCADGDGSVYVCGTQDMHVVPDKEKADFRDLPALQPHGRPHAKAAGFRGYVSKISPDGQVVWSVYLTSEGFSNAGDLAVNTRTDSLYVIGFAGGKGLHDGEFSSVYLARLKASTGERVWCKSLGIDDWPQGADPGICVDAEGCAYIVFHTGRRDKVGLLKDNTGEGSQALVAKFTPEGAVAWHRWLGGKGDDYATGVAVGPKGVYVAGWTWWFGGPPQKGEAYDFSGKSVPWRGGKSDGYVACLSPTGELEWVTLIGGSADDNCRRIHFCPAGVVAAGTGSGDLNEPLKGPKPPAGPFFAGLDLGGKLLWTSHCTIYDRATLGDLVCAGDRAFASSVGVHGLGVSQVTTNTGESLRGTGYGDILGRVDIGALRLARGGQSGVYFLADTTNLADLPKAKTRHAGRNDAFVAVVREKGAAAEKPQDPTRR